MSREGRKVSKAFSKYADKVQEGKKKGLGKELLDKLFAKIRAIASKSLAKEQR